MKLWAHLGEKLGRKGSGESCRGEGGEGNVSAFPF